MYLLAFHQSYNGLINRGFSREGGSHMQPDLLLKRDELARAHQLGEVQKEYPFRFEKWRIALGGGFFLGLFVIGGIFALISHGFEGLLVAVLALLAACLFAGLLVGGVFYYYRNAYLCVYTGGLIYLFRNKERAVRWE